MAPGPGELGAAPDRRVVAAVDHEHLGALGLDRRDPGGHRALGDDDRRREPVQSRHPGDRAAVVAVGGRDQGLARLVRRLAEQPPHRPGGAEELERRQPEAVALELQSHRPHVPLAGELRRVDQRRRLVPGQGPVKSGRVAVVRGGRDGLAPRVLEPLEHLAHSRPRRASPFRAPCAGYRPSHGTTATTDRDRDRARRARPLRAWHRRDPDRPRAPALAAHRRRSTHHPRLAGTQSSGGARTASPLPAYRQAASAASALASSDRDLTSSLRKALWRCHSTVLRVT